MRNFWLIMLREIEVKVRRKSFILTTILTPIFFVLMTTLPAILMRVNVDDGVKRIGVMDFTGHLIQHMENDQHAEFFALPQSTVEPQMLLADTLLSGVLVIPASAVADAKGVTYYSRLPATMELERQIKQCLRVGIEETRLRNAGIEGLDSIISSIKASVSVRTVVLDPEGQEKETSSTLMNVLGYVLGGVCYMLILISGMMVMNGVIEEKANRIIEVLASSVRSFELMMGKIVGIVSVFFIQLLLWGLLSVLLLGLVSPFLGDPDPKQLTGGMGVSVEVEGLTSSSALNDILAPIMALDLGAIVGAFLLFFLFGYLFYASLFAAVGSAVDEPSDASQLTTPLTMPLIIAFVSVFMVSRAPNGVLSFWFSVIPLTSPVVMPVRVIYGVPLWELLLSFGLLVVSFLALTWVAGRIYSRGILMFGRHGWRDMYRWFRTQ